MPSRCDPLYRKNDMYNFCIYTEHVDDLFLPQLKDTDWSLALLPEGLNLPCLPGPSRSCVGRKRRRLPESTLLTEAEASCQNAATSFSAASALRAGDLQCCIEGVFLG